jgi:hypothetical protein
MESKALALSNLKVWTPICEGVGQKLHHSNENENLECQRLL